METSHKQQVEEGKSVWLISDLLFHIYRFVGLHSRFFAGIITWIILRIEGGEIYSRTLRKIHSEFYGVEIGMYSYGCFSRFNFRRGTKIGRYCSIYHTVQAFNANHPMNLKSTHPFFYNPDLGITEKNLLTYTNLVIGNDVFIGHNAVILPSVNSIGDGAIIGAGSIVNKNIPPYAVVVGNPIRLVRYRYSKEKQLAIQSTLWWEKSIDELCNNLDDFQIQLEKSMFLCR